MDLIIFLFLYGATIVRLSALFVLHSSVSPYLFGLRVVVFAV